MDTPISSSTTRPAAMVHGIPNYGQTCFLNSVLQALASLEPFMVYLSHMVEVNLERRSFLQMTELNADDLSFPSLGFVLNSNENITGSDTQQPLLCEKLLDVLLSVNGQRRQSSKRNKNGATLDPRPVLQAVGKKHQQFQARYGAVTNSEQQDAQELLQAALGMVIEEGQFELTHTSALPSALASSFLSLKERDDDEEAATLVSGLFEMRLMKRGRRDALLHSLPPPPTTTTTTATTAKMIVYDDDMSKGSCAGLGERSYSPNSILPHKNELVPSTANGDMSSPSAGHGEEKKQEEFEVRIRPETSEEELLFGRCLQDRGVAISNRAVGPMSAEGKGLVCDLVLAPRVLGAMSLKEFGGPIEPVTKAMEIMMTTISSISPSPLSGWCGSVLMCASCRRVRPIQNVPCLDIPVAPTAVSDYRSHPSRSPGARLPPCRLEECLEEFTSIERVHDVECKNCTIQSEIAEQEREKEVQEQIIRGLLTRRMKRSDVSDADPNASVKFKHLRDELLAIEQRLDTLRRASPDDDEPLLAMAGNDGIDDDLAPVHIKLKRSDAFKCLLLTRLPSVLSIHVQRRYYDQATGRTSKTMQHVIFPNILDVAPYCAYGGALRPDAPFAGSTSGSCNAEPKAPISYKLMSVIEHQGGPYSGHYVSYRRDPTSIGRWLRISDDDVKVCEWATVRNCQAYMLFYEAM